MSSRAATVPATRRPAEDLALHDAIEAAVARAEEKTSAEIVVALCTASGSYRDVDYLAGAILAAAGLATMLFAPFVVSPYLVLPYALALGAVGVVLSQRSGRLRRWLTTESRRRQQVAAGARLAMIEEGVTATRQRNGVLVYVSALEQAVELVADLGVEGKVPPGELNVIRHALQAAPRAQQGSALVAAVEALGQLLAAPFPAGEDNPNEIPNRPRVRP